MVIKMSNGNNLIENATYVDVKFKSTCIERGHAPSKVSVQCMYL